MSEDDLRAQLAAMTEVVERQGDALDWHALEIQRCGGNPWPGIAALAPLRARAEAAEKRAERQETRANDRECAMGKLVDHVTRLETALREITALGCTPEGRAGRACPVCIARRALSTEVEDG